MKSALRLFRNVFCSALLLWRGFAQNPTPGSPVAHLRLSESFEAARAVLTRSSNQPAATLAFARAAFDWASVQHSNTPRAEIAQLAIDACRTCLTQHTAEAPIHYYLALNLGELARTKSLGALKIVPKIRDSLEAARRLDETLDHAGPDRSLGLLFLEAPGWPTSIGSRSKARLHLTRAVQLAPDHPENRLCLAEALLKWNEPRAAKPQLDALLALWDDARSRLAGPQYEADWRQWQKRRDELTRRLPP